jgi:hypothetical protein
MAMSHDAFPTVRQSAVSHRGEERIGFRFNSLGQQAPGAFSKNRLQRVLDGIGLTERDNTAITRHWRIGSFGSSGRLVTRLDTPPRSPRHHPVSPIAQMLSVLIVTSRQ